MRKTDKLEKEILKDCRRVMFPSLICYTAGSLISSIITVYTAGTLGRFADAVLNLDLQNGLADFGRLFICLLANIFIEPLLATVCGQITQTAGSLRHDRQILRRFLDKTFASAMSIDAGEAGSRIEDDPIELRCDWIVISENFILVSVTLAYLLYSTLRISVIFTAAVLAVSALKLTVPMLVRKIQARFTLQEKEYRTVQRSYETEITTQPHTIILYGLKNAMLKRLDTLYRTHYETVVKKSSRLNTIADSILSWLGTFCVLLILFIGALMVSRGNITAGSVAAMAGYFTVYNQMIEKIGELVRMVPVFHDDIGRVKFLYEGIEDLSGEPITAADLSSWGSSDAGVSQPGPAGGSQPEPAWISQPAPGDVSQPKPAEGSHPRPAGGSQPEHAEGSQPEPAGESQPGHTGGSQPGHGGKSQPAPARISQPSPAGLPLLCIQDLSFGYDDSQPVLSGLTFSLNAGVKIAVTGPNGSGKSTLLRILCGLRSDYEGSIRIAGKELKDLNLDSWRGCFALVQQDPWLFEGDVAENVHMRRLEASRDEVLETMERLGIRHLADRKLSFQDHSLSGGEKQRISIARALLKGSGLLLFDEPDNNLDAATSAWIRDFIGSCRETVIFISHDRALIEKADRIVSL